MRIPEMKFPFYGVLLVSSVVIGIIYILLSLKKEGFKGKNLALFIFLLAFSVVIFGKMFTVIANPKINNIFTAGFSSYGGLIGVLAASIFFELIQPSNKKIIKYSVLSLPLIYAIGKIGCFIAGCCYGIPYKGLFHVIYPSGLNIALFPVQIIETICFLVLFFILNIIKKKDGIIYITVISCATLKFLLDFLRYEHVSKAISFNQIFSILLVISTIICYFVIKRKEKLK